MSILRKYSQLRTNDRLYLFFISFFWLYGFVGALWTRVGVDSSIANTILLFVLAKPCHGKWKNL